MLYLLTRMRLVKRAFRARPSATAKGTEVFFPAKASREDAEAAESTRGRLASLGDLRVRVNFGGFSDRIRRRRPESRRAGESAGPTLDGPRRTAGIRRPTNHGQF